MFHLDGEIDWYVKNYTMEPRGVTTIYGANAITLGPATNEGPASRDLIEYFFL